MLVCGWFLSDHVRKIICYFYAIFSTFFLFLQVQNLLTFYCSFTRHLTRYSQGYLWLFPFLWLLQQITSQILNITSTLGICGNCNTKYIWSLPQFPVQSAVCLVAQWSPTLCDPMGCSLPGSSIHEDSLGKNTGVGCIPSSRGSSQPRDRTQVSHITCGFFTSWVTREALFVQSSLKNI